MKNLVSAVAAIGVLAVGFSVTPITTASAASAAYCDNQARQYANSKAGGNAIAGGVIGGIGGAIAGTLLGGKGGTAPGAIIGGVGGVVVGGSTWQKYYNQVYYQCVNQAPVYQQQPAYAPPVGSQAWKQQCAQKYKSFQWDTGYYLGFDGGYHVCKLP